MEPVEKICKECQVLKPIEEFDKNQYNKAGEVVRRSTCRDCRKYKKPIPTDKRRKYELENPRPKMGDIFFCPICERSLTVQKKRDINLDHDHKTGEIRGYVCNDCNTGIGNLRDDVNVLNRAIRWLKGLLASFW